MTHVVPDALFPVTQDTVEAAFDWIFAPWVKDLGLTGMVACEGFCSMRLPLGDHLRIFSGAVCGQALMAAIDTVASMSAATGLRTSKGTVYQHTHFPRPAANDDFLIAATVRRFGNASAYIDCSVTFVSSGELAAHAVLEFAY